jgi:hypothetical protein
VRGDRVVENQRLTSRGGALSTQNYDYGKSECGFRVNLTLPAGARYGAYYKLSPGGDQGLTGWLTPEMPRGSVACSLGGGGPSTCSLLLVLPPGAAAASPPGQAFTDLLEFWTSDATRIQALKQDGTLSGSQAFSVGMDLEFLSCRKPYAPTGTADAIIFGSSNYHTTYYDDPDAAAPYSVLSYRAYEVRGAAAASWRVDVARSFRSSGGTTPLDVMLLRDADYQKWVAGCDTTCRPPRAAALGGTLCTGTACRGRKSRLGRSGTYWLLVAYPRVSSDTWDGTYSNTRPVSSAYAKQLVTVALTPA